MEPKVIVSVKSSWWSKINWTQAVALVAMAGTVLNMFELTPEDQVKILAGITAVQSSTTWMWKTFFTSTITPSSVPPNAMRE